MLRRSLSRISPLLSNGLLLRSGPRCCSSPRRFCSSSHSSATLNPSVSQEEESRESPRQAATVSIDRSGLYNPPAGGDFITSPDVSQMFGEKKREKKNLESDIALRLHDSSPVGDFFSLCREQKCLPAGTAKNRSSAINFGRWRSIEGEIGSIEGEKGKKKKRKRKKRREEENLVPVLARAPSWPSLTVRRRTVARGSPTPVTARTRARRRNASPRGEKDRGDMVGVWTMCLWEQMGQPENVNLVELGPGRGTLMADLLRGIRKHKFVDILDNPGSADLSAYVDFASVRHSAEEVSDNISVHGPITQSQFLGSLGINFRVEALLQNCTEEQAESLRTGYWRLVGDGEAPFWEGPDELTPIGMGTRYLAMAIVNKKQGTPIPFE
ncbi:hypothetical protein GW17_00026906 [Ensete ventricosum]|nr:hypothetical protein GW17_00026906 [Ensete ventricosum]RZR93895.1 hypothetical protein BHM03_00022476 [Ensete ventricosum]